MFIRDIIPPQKMKIKKETLKPSKLLAGFTILLLISQLIGIGYLFYPPVKQAKAAGNTYYVDNTVPDNHTGSCTPDLTVYNHDTFAQSGGTDSVFATIADVNACNSTQLPPGSNVYFRKSQTWREQLTVPSSGSAGSPITFGAYGSGANPIIDPSILVVDPTKTITNLALYSEQPATTGDPGWEADYYPDWGNYYNTTQDEQSNDIPDRRQYRS